MRDARRAAGLTQEAVAQVVGVSRSFVAKVESGSIESASIPRLARIASVLGLELGVRVFPVGSPLRDAGHLALLGRLRAHLTASWTWRTEVPLPVTGDLRSWDAMIRRGDIRIGIEAETRPTDLQALERRIHLKQRDAGIDIVVLVIADTRTNRQLVRSMSEVLRVTFPTPARELLGALEDGHAPPGSGIILL